MLRGDTRYSGGGAGAERKYLGKTVAHDYFALAEGVDLSQGSGRRAGGGDISRAPGAAVDGVRESRPFEDARGLDAEVQAGGVVRRARAITAGDCGAGTE